MKTILVPVERHESTDTILSLAVLAAKRLGASIEGFALRRLSVAALGWEPAGVPLVSPAEWEQAEAAAAAEARAAFDAAMAGAGVPAADPGVEAVDAPVWHWCAEVGAGDEFLGSYARAFDLTVVGKPGPGGGGSSVTTLEAALFESGGPILMAPHREMESLGETIVIVWNGSSETSRTIAFAWPFLRQARRVMILADDGGRGHRPSGELMRRRLARNGVEAELKLLPDGQIRNGEVLLGEAAKIGCDLLVKGAYTQSRLRQMIFGGATQQVLAGARIPVFTAH